MSTNETKIFTFTVKAIITDKNGKEIRTESKVESTCAASASRALSKMMLRLGAKDVTVISSTKKGTPRS